MGKYFLIVLCWMVFLASPTGGVLIAAGQQAEGSIRFVRVDAQTLDSLPLDDADRDSLLQASERSRRYLMGHPGKLESPFFSTAVLLRTLQELEDVVAMPLSGQELAREIRNRFDFFVFQTEATEQRMLITGYYEPEFAGSLQKRAPYLSPVFGVPDDLVVSAGRPEGQRVWRRADNLLYSYWRRSDIEAGSLSSEHALAYLADPVEAFLLHVQGSGRIKLPDGMVKKIRYAANNGLEYRSIGRLLVERGILQTEQVSMPRIVSFLRNHPEERREILDYNDRYIFFRWEEKAEGGDAEGPIGSMGEALTAGRSVALDARYYPPGVVGFLQTKQPRFDRQGRVFSWVSLNRFVFAQDTGAAIKGRGRLDMFYGNGPFAEGAAGVMRQHGSFWLLVKKDQGLDFSKVK